MLTDGVVAALQLVSVLKFHETLVVLSHAAFAIMYSFVHDDGQTTVIT